MHCFSELFRSSLRSILLLEVLLGIVLLENNYVCACPCVWVLGDKKIEIEYKYTTKYFPDNYKHCS